jgi:tetratricopeptide (TPR) repeat protein
VDTAGLAQSDLAATLYNRSLCHEMAGQTDQSLQDLDAVLTLNPNDALALNSRGVLLTAKGDYDLAIADFDKASALRPGEAKHAYNRAIANFRKGDYERAVLDYTEALRLQPRYARAYTNRGLTLNALGRFDLALADFASAIRIEPTSSLAFYGRGNANNAKGNFGQAIKDFTAATNLAPDAPNGYNRLAWLYATCPVAQFRDGKRALANAQMAVTLSRVGVTLDTLAAAQARAGQLREAAATQQEAIDLLQKQYNPAPVFLEPYRDRLALYKSGSAFAE